MLSIKEIKGEITDEKPKKIGERHLLVGELYNFYLSPKETLHRKKENWKRYIIWLREKKQKDTKENQKKFKKSKKFLRTLKLSGFSSFIRHIPTEDLYYCLSMCKDVKGSCIAWLFSRIR